MAFTVTVLPGHTVGVAGLNRMFGVAFTTMLMVAGPALWQPNELLPLTE